MFSIWKTSHIALKVLIAIWSLSNFISTANCQSTKYFEKLYPTPFPHFEEGWSVHTLSDGYIIGGGRSYSASDWEFFLFKTDLYGNQIWEVCIPDTLTSKLIYSSVVVSDGLILTGYDRNISSNKYSTLVIKIDTSGAIIWQKSIGDSIRDNYALSIIQTFDGGFALTGLIADPISSPVWEGYLIKTDSAANVIWTKEYTGPLRDPLHSIKQLEDSSFIMTGVSNFALGSGELRFIKTDSSGSMTFDTSYIFLGNNTQIGWDISKSLEGGYIIGGTTGSAGVTTRGLIFKTDYSGNVIYSKILSEFSNGSGALYGSNIYRFFELMDSTIIGIGSLRLISGVPLPYVHQLLIVKLDKYCNEIWRRLYNPNFQGDTFGADMDFTPDGGFIISCQAGSPNNADVYLVKTNCLGYTSGPQANFNHFVNGTTATFTNLSLYSDTCVYYFGDGDSLMITYLDTLPVSHTYNNQGWFDPYLIAYACGEIDTLSMPLYSGFDELAEIIENSFTVFPNPAHEKITVSYNVSSNIEFSSLTLKDINGRTLKNQFVSSQSHETILDVSSIAPGVYKLIIQTDKVRDVVKKLVILK